MIKLNAENYCHDCPAQIDEIDRYKENLYEVLELFRKTINKDFDDWKDADDWLFSNLNLTEKRYFRHIQRTFNRVCSIV